VTDPWGDYLAAARRLGASRRRAAAAVVEQAAALRAAGEELAAVRARLAPQQARLRDAGVPETFLTPNADELAAAAAAMSGGPTAVLAALREARATADAADAALMGPARFGTPAASPSGWPAGLRNLLVYGPLALVMLIVQVAIYASVSETALPVYVPLCGLVMPAAAFGLGWLTVGWTFPAGPTGRVDRTPLVGAAVCLAPVVATCVGVGALAVIR
jgi:hypothetical protein